MGLCECGCGEKTSLATKTSTRAGLRKGEPCRFLPGHQQRRGPDYVVDDNGCWLWQRALNKGYGATKRGGIYSAHLLYYIEAHGPVPDGLQIDHLCQVKHCVNPDHMEPVTAAENMRRRPVTKLTADLVEEIRSLLAGGWARTDIAPAYGVSHHSITDIALRRTWKD